MNSSRNPKPEARHHDARAQTQKEPPFSMPRDNGKTVWRPGPKPAYLIALLATGPLSAKLSTA